MLVWESSETHKLGIFRFYLFTEHLTNGDEVFTEMTEGTDQQTDADEHQKNTTEDNEQMTQKAHEREQQTHTVEAFVSTAVEIVDLTFLCDTSEVPLQGGPFLEDLDDTIFHEPIEKADKHQCP